MTAIFAGLPENTRFAQVCLLCDIKALNLQKTDLNRPTAEYFRVLFVGTWPPADGTWQRTLSALS